MTHPAYPAWLRELAAIDLSDVDTDDFIDLAVDDDWRDDDELTDWWRAWTGRDDASTPPLLVFGEDGSGGLVALHGEEGTPLEERPVVFVSSEGTVGVAAANLADLFDLLAHGIGPMEIVEFGVTPCPPHPEVVALHQAHVGRPPAPVAELVARAEQVSVDLPVDAD